MANMGDSMDFLITLDQFEGPLDLMLHLIKENKLDLFDLDMNVLATQYIDYIHVIIHLFCMHFLFYKQIFQLLQF